MPDPERPVSNAALNAHLAQWGGRLKSPGEDRPPVAPDWEELDTLDPADASPSTPVSPPGVFGPAAQVRFLDSVAGTGNVRISAGRAGVSHETAYRLRRRDARFSQLWDAALVYARRRVAAVLGDRALDGVVEEVWCRGEMVGQRRRYDSSLLLAHPTRLDALVANAAADDQAAWFDAGLARLAGRPEPVGFADAQGLWDEDRRSGPDPGEEADEDPAALPPPTRATFAAWYASQALTGVKRKDEDRVHAEAHAQAGALYDAWRQSCPGAVDAVLASEGEGLEWVPVDDAPRTPSHVSHRHAAATVAERAGGAEPPLASTVQGRAVAPCFPLDGAPASTQARLMNSVGMADA